MKRILIISFLLLVYVIIIQAQNTLVVTSIDSLLSNSYPENEPGVSVLISKENKVLLKKAYGLANIELGREMQTNNVFKISSVTKPITALGIFILANQKKISLTCPIIDYIPELNKEYSTVQIKHLLSHTSGIPSYTCTDEYEELFTKYYYHYVNEEISGDSIFNIINKHGLEFEPGEQFAYCNSGYFILEKIIEKVSGQKFENFMKENVFEPLEMENTRFFSPTQIIPNRVTGYTYLENEIVNNPHTFLSGILTKGPGGILSTTEDLYSFYLGITETEYFKKISYDKYIAPFFLNDSTESVYSYGFFTRKLKGHRMISHNGDGSGFSSSLVILPDENIFIAILSNNDMYSRGSSRYHENIAKRIAARLVNDPYPEYKRIKLPEKDLAKYEGTYKSEDGVLRKISLAEGALFHQRNNGRKIQIYPFSKSSFYFDGYLIQINFNTDDYGKIKSLTVYYDDGRIISATKMN